MWYSYWCDESRERVRKNEFPLHTAAAGNDSEKLKILLGMKEDEIWSGKRSLGTSSWKGSELRQKHRGVCKRHIRGGGRCSYCLDQYNPDGFTPLHCAAYSGNPECVELLLKAGAYFNPRNKDDNTPIQIAEGWVLRWGAAAGAGHTKCVELLQKEVDSRKSVHVLRLRMEEWWRGCSSESAQECAEAAQRQDADSFIDKHERNTYYGGGTPYTDPSQWAGRHHYQQEIFAVQQQQHYNRTGAYV